MKLLFISKILSKKEMQNGITLEKIKLEIEMQRLVDKKYKNMQEELKKKEMN